MGIKGQTVYVLIIEGQYPGNNSNPEVFASNADATARKTELEAIREGVEGHWSHQVHWCYVEEMTIQ